MRNLCLRHPVFDALLLTHNDIVASLGRVLDAPASSPTAVAMLRDATFVADALFAHLPHAPLVADALGLEHLYRLALCPDLPTKIHALMALCTVTRSNPMLASLPSQHPQLIPTLVLSAVDDNDTESESGSDGSYEYYSYSEYTTTPSRPPSAPTSQSG